MRPHSKYLLVLIAALSLLWGGALAADDSKEEHDRSRISVFVQPSVSFLNFEQREYFQDAIDTIYKSFQEDALTEKESLNVAKQDFQKVNFCFPLSAGIQYQFLPDHFISAGLGFIYDHESVVLVDRKNRTHNYDYTLQGVPLYLEYRFAIPKNFMTLSGESLFSISLRWYWVLPGTEIYTTWGKLDAETPVTGAGYGVSLGYLMASWKSLKIYGDFGFSSIGVKSGKTFADIVPDGPEKKARWNIGGLQMQIRISFGFLNEPEPVDEEDDKESESSSKDKEQVGPSGKEKNVKGAAAPTANTPDETPAEKIAEIPSESTTENSDKGNNENKIEKAAEK